MSSTTSFSVNGREVEVRGDHPHLLAALREELGITSPKDGCSPSGQCGACTVLLDGKPVDDDSRRIIGYLPEERGLYKKMKVLEHLTYLGTILIAVLAAVLFALGHIVVIKFKNLFSILCFAKYFNIPLLGKRVQSTGHGQGLHHIDIGI